MKYRNVDKSKAHIVGYARHDFYLRRRRGAVTPFIAMSVILIMGTLGISIDLMRDFEAANQLQFGAQSVALYALSLATNSNGSYLASTAQTNIQSAIAYANTQSWNSTQSGPQSGVWNTPITIAPADVAFINNPNPQDPNEFFVQLTARCNGNNALQQFFIPLLYTRLSGRPVPQSVRAVTTDGVIEVLGQPASRIGAGPPVTTSAGTRSGDLVGFAALPLAISNQQFAIAANPTQTNTVYTVDLVSSTSSEYTGAAPINHIKGCFVNDAATGGSGSYYGGAQGDKSINQLEGLLNYFGATSTQQTITPAVVERGSQLGAFDPADPAFVARQIEITQILSQPQSQLLNKFYIIPVLANDPVFGATNTNVIAGFARLELTQVNLTNGTVSSFTFAMAQPDSSVPVRNASSATGFSSIPTNVNILMPNAVYPFTPRQYDPNSNGVTSRPRGVVLAPAISPRPIRPS